MRLQFDLGTRRFSASPWFLLLTAAGMALFIALGRWQWHRAAEKQAMEDAFARGTLAITPLGQQPLTDIARYTQLQVHGRYDGAHQFLLDNLSRDGQAGYEVLTPLRLDDGRVLMVNRGWLPGGGDRRQLPDVQLDDGPAVTLVGRYDHLPVTALAMGRAAPAAQASWPKLTSFPTSAELAAALQSAEPAGGGTLQEGQLLLDADQSRGYRRDWQPASAQFGPARHLSYAIQWWGLAALAALLFIVMNLKKRPA
ncbi:MAG: SURF1 family protein [Steroidobacteraceae bacterium]